MTRQLSAITEFSRARPERVIHVGYPDVIADPAATAHGIFAATDRPDDPGLTEKIAGFLHAQRAGGRLAPPADLPTMGYTEEDVRSEAAVRDYCARFNVLPERERLVGVHA